jgi:hypothetical protein
VKATVSGNLTDCNHSPVRSGQVILQKDGVSRAFTANSTGAFSFSFPVCNTGSPESVRIIGQDKNTSRTGLPVTLSVQPGANDAGSVSTCFNNASEQEFINYSIDSNYFTFQSPVDTFRHAIHTGSGWHSFTGTDKLNSSRYMFFTCYQNAALGTKSPGLDEFFISPFYSRHTEAGLDSVAVTYTEFGPVGGFIAGHFTITIIDLRDRSVHVSEVSFRIRRRK